MVLLLFPFLYSVADSGDLSRIVSVLTVIDEKAADDNEYHQYHDYEREQPLSLFHVVGKGFCTGFKLSVLSGIVLYVEIVVAVIVACRLVVERRVSDGHFFVN